MSDWIVPDRRIVKALRKATERQIGRRYRDWPVLRWDEGRQALCIFEKTKDGFETHKFTLEDEEELARQATEEDVERYIKNRFGWTEGVDKWRRDFEQRKVDRKDAAEDARKERAHEMAERIYNVWHHGLKTHVEVGGS